MDLDTQYLHDLYNLRQPKRYADVAQLFESNYHKILKLVPLLQQTAHHSVIRHLHQADLHLLVEQRFTHTAIFKLTHILGEIRKPDIKFKLYFDAQLLEVISVCNQTTLNQNHPYLAQCSDMNMAWELNLFMEKWLDYCLDNYRGKSWQTA
jgi:uncharacterized protein YqiB (DUF1249 family)